MRCLSVLDLVILFYLFIFFLAAKLKRSTNGASILFVNFSVTYPLKGM